MKMSRRRFISSLLALGGLAAIDVGVLEPRVILSVSEVELSFDSGWGYTLTVAHVSDIHMPPGPSLVYEQAVKRVEERKPDLIVFTGDSLSSEAGKDEAKEFLSRLSELAPTYAVWGNWDYYSLGHRVPGYGEELEREGVEILANEATRIEGGVWLVGVDDPYTARDDLGKALSGVPREAFKILLAHSPQVIGEARDRVDLVLAGHTHGGQVRLPLIGPLYVPLPSQYRGYVSGLYEVGGMKLYVNRGLGTSILPVRLLCPPELTIYTLEF